MRLLRSVKLCNPNNLAYNDETCTPFPETEPYSSDGETAFRLAITGAKMMRVPIAKFQEVGCLQARLGCRQR